LEDTAEAVRLFFLADDQFDAAASSAMSQLLGFSPTERLSMRLAIWCSLTSKA
jgi:hypothetical protein